MIDAKMILNVTIGALIALVLLELVVKPMILAPMGMNKLEGDTVIMEG